MIKQKSLTSLVTGASVTMVALTSFALLTITSQRIVPGTAFFQLAWPMILASSCAILLVMSLLHADLQKLYALVAEREEQARQEARHDPLTGLGNRKLLVEELETRLGSVASEAAMALLLVDLNQFKRINDTMGHDVGDKLIVAAGERIRAMFPEAVAASRLGGDEFAVIVDLKEEKLSSICENLANRLTIPFEVDGNELFIGGSVGAAFFGLGLNASQMLRRADVAMYRAKSSKSGYQIYDSSLIAYTKRREKLAIDLQRCLEERKGLRAVFQAIVTPNGEMQALEALLRWRHENFGSIPPLEIISIAEETHLLNEVSLFMIREAAQAAIALPDFCICLNMKAVQIQDFKFVDSLIRTVAQNGFAAGQLQLEIQEGDFVDRGCEIAPALAALRDAGIKIAVDDFGSSTASLAHLRRLGVTTLKLDPSTDDISNNISGITVMRAKVRLAKALGMTVVCESVNSLLDETVAIQAGCDLLQGFRYSHPSSLSTFLNEREKRGSVFCAIV